MVRLWRATVQEGVPDVSQLKREFYIASEGVIPADIWECLDPVSVAPAFDAVVESLLSSPPLRDIARVQRRAFIKAVVSLVRQDVQRREGVHDRHGAQADGHDPFEQVDDVARVVRPVVRVVDDAARPVGADVVAVHDPLNG